MADYPKLLGVEDALIEPAGLSAIDLPYILAPPPNGGDDYGTIQALINANNPLGVWVRLRQGQYLSSAEFAPVAGSPLLLCGVPHVYGNATKSSTIKLTQAARSVAQFSEPYSKICGVRLDANRFGTYGVYVANGVAGHLIDGCTTNALLDGIHCEGAGLNQAIETQYWFSYENGKLYATAAILGQYAAIGAGSALVRQPAITGTATTVAGGDTITIIGGPNLATLGIRIGDVLRVGSVAAASYFGQIASVTSNTIIVGAILDNRPTVNAAGQDYAIGIGFGLYEELNGGGGFCFPQRSWFRGNGAMGIWANSLYGDHIVDCLTDFNCSGGIALGIAWNGGSCLQPSVEGVYTEGCIGPDYLLGNVQSGHIINPGGGNAIFSVGGSQAEIAIHRKGRVESQQLGAEQNFLFEIKPVGGVLKHRIVANHYNGYGSLAADKITGATVAFTTTPTVDATHDFAAGAGIFSAGGTLVVLLNTAATQNVASDASPLVEFDDTPGRLHGVALEVQANANVNGNVRNWIAFYLTDNTGALINWSPSNIPDGKTIGIRFSGKVR